MTAFIRFVGRFPFLGTACFLLFHSSNRSFAVVLGDVFRFPSSWRFPFLIVSDMLSQNRHSALLAASCQLTALPPNSRFLSLHILSPFPVILNGGKNACVEKTGNGMVTQSEESIALMTPYRLPHNNNRFFVSALNDVLPLAPLFIYYLLPHICI